jgi:hypothetical protein
MKSSFTLRKPSYRWIVALPKDKEFETNDIYKFLETDYAAQVKLRGDAGFEPRYKNDARWAIYDAKSHGIVQHMHRDVYRRV